jgi:hypothetical protein
LLTGTRVFLFGYRPRSIVGSGYSRSISAGGSWRPYLLVFRVWLIRSLTPPKTELPATIANRRPKVEKYRGNFGAQRGARGSAVLLPLRPLLIPVEMKKEGQKNRKLDGSAGTGPAKGPRKRSA